MPETCEHSWSCEKPWSFSNPGPCVKCGTPRTDPYIATLRDIAEHYVRPLLPLHAAELEDYAGRLESALRNTPEASHA